MPPSRNEEPLEPPLGDVMADVPLFREIQRVLLASTGPINWELARQVGIAVATWGGEDPGASEEDSKGLEAMSRAAELAVVDFTGLPPPSGVADVRGLRRAQWVEANVRSLRGMLDPVAARWTEALGNVPGVGAPTLGEAAPDAGDAAMLGVLMQRMAPLLLGAQVGSVLGSLGQRVLAQFDLAVPRDSGNLYFVVPNIIRFESDWSLPPVEFRAWVALHEVTHRFEFARPWVNGHFLHLVRDLVEHAELDLSALERRLEELDLSDPGAISQAVEGLRNPFAEATTDEQRLRVARLQAFMAAAEGYGDHVAEALGRRMLSSFSRIEEALRRHREGRVGDQALEQLLGLEVRPEQYRLARKFCEDVASRADEESLGRMWESPETLPSMPELEEPLLWLARIG